MLGVALARPDRPLDARSFGRVPLAASRLWGGKTRAFVSPAAARASSLRVRGGTTRGKRACRDAGVCRACRSLGRVTRGGERTKGPRARTPECRGTPIPPLPRGCAGTSVGARSRAGRAGLGGGGLPGPTRPPSVPAASGPSRASPSLPFPRTAASPRASRACVARVACRVEVASLPLPGSVPTFGEQRLTRPSLGSGFRFWLCGVVTSLSGAAFGENGGRSSPGASPDASGPVASGGPSFGGGGRVCLGGGSVREGARGAGFARFGNLAREGGLADVRRLRRWRWVRRPRCVWGLFRPRRRRPPGRRVSRGGTATAPGWVPGGEIPPRLRAFSPPVRRRGLRSMTLPVPEVRARPSVVGRGVPPPVPRGEDRPRVVVVSLPPPASPPRLRARARPALSRRLGPLRLRLPSGGRPPSVSPAKPVGAVCRLPPGRFPVSRPRPERVRDHPAVPGVAPRCRVCAGGPPRPHTRSRAPARGRRLGTAAWSVGAVRRAGARPSRGGSAVPGGWPLPVPATRRPPPALLSRSSVRVPPCAARRSLRRRVGGLRGFPSFPRAAAVRGSRLSLSPPAWVSCVLRVLRSLAPARASRPASLLIQLALLPG